ncbi:MAG: 50S ribosomal protein L32 [Alphaproteobacteria bacterium CG_4_10_14_0_8_um_filter_53_9]|nr:MAG: 50S ribosomal protein L32 [Alphaproteobacteria bacterium CG_4_10_14_0_8_um_filter_53_9]
MAVPKRKTSPSKRGMRRSHHNAEAAAQIGSYAESPDTGTLVRRHHATREADGSMWYRGKMIKPAKIKADAEVAAE